jgi:polyisoprenoid-binding protein YceI
MAFAVGRHALEGRVTLRTSRDGLAAQAGHDLRIDVGQWSGELVIGPDLAPAGLAARLDLGSLVVQAGTGGIKPLTDRDKREILATMRKVLSADRYPDATFTASSFSPAVGGGTIDGTLTLAGQSAALRLDVRQTGPDRYLARTTVRQTSFGIKPYSGFLGALRVSDAVEVEANVAVRESIRG